MMGVAVNVYDLIRHTCHECRPFEGPTMAFSPMRGDPATLDPHPREDVTLRCGDTCITLNSRLAGATWSMTYRGQELILPQPGNGGSLQSACAFDVRPGTSPEAENPTEAGNVNDNAGATSSEWKVCRVNADHTEAYTETLMAYFWPPGRPMESGPDRGPPRNTSVLSRVTLAKHLVFLAPDLLRYTVAFCLPADEPHWFAQVEALTGYMHPSTLPCRWKVAAERGRGGPFAAWTPVPSGDAPAARPGTPAEGMVYASRGGAFAFGVAAVDWPPGGHVYAGDEAAPPWAGTWQDPYKWNYVHHFNAQVSPEDSRIPTGALGYSFLLATGDLERVRGVIAQATLLAAAKCRPPA